MTAASEPAVARIPATDLQWWVHLLREGIHAQAQHASCTAFFGSGEHCDDELSPCFELLNGIDYYLEGVH